MRIDKNGNIRLDKRDRRVGNFVFTEEGEYIRIQDISRFMILRVRKGTNSYANLLHEALSEHHDVALGILASFSYLVNTSMLDPKCIGEICDSIEACIGRHAEAFGSHELSDEEHDAILKGVQEFQESVGQGE